MGRISPFVNKINVVLSSSVYEIPGGVLDSTASSEAIGRKFKSHLGR